MLCAEDLLQLELFQTLPKTRLDWICDRVQTLQLAEGETLVQEGDAPRGFFVLIEGKIAVTRMSEGVDMLLGQHEAPTFFGEIPVLTEEPVMVTLRALTPCQVYQLSGDDFRDVLHACRAFERTVFRTVEQRLRGLESFIRNREKMAALGTLAAGLAHELNNPAAALVRTLKEVTPALIELQRMNLVYGQRQVEATHTQQWLNLRDAGYEAILHRPSDALGAIDREAQILDWLEDYGVEDAWKLAEPIAAGGVEAATLEALMERWRDDPTELREMGLRWLALSFDVMSMIASGLRSSERIFELVQSMKSYSHVDRGAQQWVDIHEGIEDTLRLFSYKIKKGIEIRRNYDLALPQILAYGSELNQVWTNLIDNAIDAMDGKGAIELATTRQGDRIQIQITDNGPGIPVELQSRVFEPFFTTKPVGKGSGLGLDIVRRIIENRHQGSMVLDSQRSRTQFTICLPLTQTHSPPSEIVHEP
ncbi:MAG: ATP-binding protein [Thermosynechococcaceae cyanobacterium]